MLSGLLYFISLCSKCNLVNVNAFTLTTVQEQRVQCAHAQCRNTVFQLQMLVETNLKCYVCNVTTNKLNCC